MITTTSFETSAKLNTNIEECAIALVRDIVKKEPSLTAPPADTIRLTAGTCNTIAVLVR